MTTEAMLTTVDNPHSPFTEFDAWYAYDTRMGYDSCGLLARITFSSGELSETDNELSVEQAIDEIIKENVSGMHLKVTKDSERV